MYWLCLFLLLQHNTYTVSITKLHYTRHLYSLVCVTPFLFFIHFNVHPVCILSLSLSFSPHSVSFSPCQTNFPQDVSHYYCHLLLVFYYFDFILLSLLLDVVCFTCNDLQNFNKSLQNTIFSSTKSTAPLTHFTCNRSQPREWPMMRLTPFSFTYFFSSFTFPYYHSNYMFILMIDFYFEKSFILASILVNCLLSLFPSVYVTICQPCASVVLTACSNSFDLITDWMTHTCINIY